MRYFSSLFYGLLLLLSFSLQAQSVTWLSPTPAPELSSGSVLNSNTIVMVGASGVIIKSTDQGATWTTCATNCSNDLITVVSEGNYVLAAGNNIILKSMDKGDHWTIAFSDDEKIINALAIYNNTFYASGYNVSGTTLTDFILKSTDLGNTWHTIYQDDYHYGSKCLQFISPNTGFFMRYDKPLAKTVDGGRTWTDVTSLPSDYFINMQWLNKDFGLLSSLSGSYRTRNGGSTWEKFTSYNAVFFIDPLQGFNPTYSASSPCIAKTLNGGDTWSSFTSVPGFNFPPVKIDILGNLGFAIGNFPNQIAITRNAGNSWENISTSLTLPFPGSYINAICFFDSTKGIIGTGTCHNEMSHYSCGFGGILKSTNSGKDWQTMDSTIGPDFKKILRYDDSTAFSIGYTGGGTSSHGSYQSYSINKSTDKGSTWKNVYTSNANLTDICFNTKSNGYIIASNGTLFHSNDYGNTWTPNERFSNSYLLKIRFNDPLNGIILSTSGIYTTKNGGISWDSTHFGMDYSFTDIEYKYGLAFLSGYKTPVSDPTPAAYFILRSQDMGRSWKQVFFQQPIKVSYSPTIKFVSSQLGYIFSSPSYYTSDGGLRWYEFNMNLNATDVSLVDSNTAYLVWANSIRRVKFSSTDYTHLVNNDPDKTIMIFPNPSEGQLTILFSPQLNETEVSIFDALGKKVYSAKQDKNYMIVDLTSIISGIYFVQVNDEKNFISQKIIVK